MAILFIITGLPLSGKSSVARVLGSRLGADVIDLDGLNEVRGVRTPNGTPMAEWARTYETAEAYIRGSLSLGRHVVVDWVNYPKTCDRWRRAAATAAADVHLVCLTTSADTVRQRHASSGTNTIDASFLETVIDRWAPPQQAIELSGTQDANAFVTELLAG